VPLRTIEESQPGDYVGVPEHVAGLDPRQNNLRYFIQGSDQGIALWISCQLTRHDLSSPMAISPSEIKDLRGTRHLFSLGGNGKVFPFNLLTDLFLLLVQIPCIAFDE
jgi:hypothetical protein